ncbi:CUB and zona pellucida-like domain-containing protein 1 [Diadema antillarum]|uniref:CUB and zona pellucida-like domain-containing protein 1 n=1 Tax=Diadema antillarum TaxID=105358 RepID=UPI003A89744E
MALRFVFISLALLAVSGVQSQELDTTGIVLTCTESQMIVEIPKTLLTGEMAGDNVRFENAEASDESCWGYDDTNDESEDIIELTTNLTACGTNRTENAEEEIYTNRVISRYESDDVISRQYAIDIPLSCSYNRSKRVSGGVSYQLTDYTIDKTLEEEGAYTFSFDIYEDETYQTAVSDYPYSIGLNEALHFAASVLSLESTLALSIRSCRATPTSNYDNSIFYDFILDGFSEDDLTSITLLTDSRIGVEMNTLRFIEQGEFVYIHCNLLVCDAENGNSLCSGDAARTPGIARRRRDVGSTSNTKRFTRGPLRVVRSAQNQQNSISRLETSDNGVTQEEVTSAFNPWMVAMAAMATVVMALAAMMVVVMRKLNKISSPRQRQSLEEAVHLLDDHES